jgi:hypothetical protein
MYRASNCPVIKKPVIIWSDSPPIVKKIKALIAYKPHASQCMLPESEGVATIFQLMKDLPQITIQVLPAKEQYHTSPLSLPGLTQLSLHQATQASMDITNTNQPMSPMPGQRATLYINNIEVSVNYQAALRTAALTPAFHKYLIHRHPTWTTTIIGTIDWQIHQRALHRLPTTHRKTIKQFIHRWLPVNAHPGSSHAISNLCPMCNIDDETQTHFLSCNNHRMHDSWKKAYSPTKESNPHRN